ncbi:hypothetical protein HanXRQr2_Chr04g0143961 [Helianthus annuus]|uniref:Uncharacterized protein n=1 Tax=Helianthus annuus TaxID=4232 RepID=A0A9K3J5J1_HELAN|nr:hypothetical protein HanXRQr2_Chr04g0143961 [Helianthus annuus]
MIIDDIDSFLNYFQWLAQAINISSFLQFIVVEIRFQCMLKSLQFTSSSSLILLQFKMAYGLRTGNSPIFGMQSATTVRKNGADEFLNSENDKNDYDWLLTPPGTPLFPSLEMGSSKTVMNQNGTHKAHPSAAKSRVRAIPFTFENTSLTDLLNHC